MGYSSYRTAYHSGDLKECLKSEKDISLDCFLRLINCGLYSFYGYDKRIGASRYILYKHEENIGLPTWLHYYHEEW